MRIKLNKPIWIIDNYNKYIYWFSDITSTNIKGIIFKKNGKTDGGIWNKKEWVKLIKSEPETRFKEIDFKKLTKKRKRILIIGIFNYDF
jgi:hypothetical protein